MRVLIVDDDSAVRALIAMTLSLEGIAVSTATDGAAALDRIQTETARFDLIVLDLSMPVMDGRTFYHRLQTEHVSPPPVLLLSGDGAQSAHQELGAAGWLDKPFDVDVLLARVFELAGLQRP